MLSRSLSQRWEEVRGKGAGLGQWSEPPGGLVGVLVTGSPLGVPSL